MSTEEVVYWGVGEQKMATYGMSASSTMSLAATGYNVYFGSKLVRKIDSLGTATSMQPDRLGSFGKYAPYGEDRTAPADGTEKFATYYQDAGTGLDYAVNRYYNSGSGRFMSADPYQASGGPGDLGSWNRFSYTRGDPRNRVDPSGLMDSGGCGTDSGPTDCLMDAGTAYAWYGGDYVPNGPGATAGTTSSMNCAVGVGTGFMPGGGGSGSGAGFDPNCYMPEPPPTAVEPRCGDVFARIGPDTAEGRNMIAVLLGEDSWTAGLVGKPQLPGATTTGGGSITRSDVALEEAYMVATMRNLAAAYHQSVDWTITHNQYGGYSKGLQLLNDFLDEAIDSDDCEHLITAIAALQVGATLNVPYTQWRASRNTKTGRPTRLRTGAIRIAGTDFF